MGGGGRGGAGEQQTAWRVGLGACEVASEVAQPVDSSCMFRWLREHQRQGVRFVFDCLMGLKDFDGYGCILADDMGLGKTLQSITVLWTLLEQGIDTLPGRYLVAACFAALDTSVGGSNTLRMKKAKCTRTRLGGHAFRTPVIEHVASE